MDSPNFQFETKTEYKDRDKGTGAWAIKPGPEAIPPIPFVPGDPVFTEDFEGVPWSDLFLVSVDGWSVQTIDAHSPTHSFETDHLGAYVYSFVFNDFSFSPQLSFWFKADMVPSASDVFEVLFDGVPVFTVTTPVTDWTYVALSKGFTFNIEFRFTQNFPIVTNGVFVRVDDIVVGELDTPGVPGSPAHPFVYAPLVLCEDDRLLVSPAIQTVLGVPEVLVAEEDFETDPISGFGTWTLTGDSPHTGLRCLRSAVIGGSQNTDYTFSVPPGADTIKVWSRVSSEGGFDFFRIYKDSIDPDNLLYQKSGTENIWEQQTLDITGATSVIFRYIKDSSVSSGLDAAFIDDIEWITAEIPASEQCAPLHLNAEGQLDIRNLDCTTDSVTVCPPVSGVFDVNVVNQIDDRFLDCDTDSITVCPPVSGFDVTINPGDCPIPVVGCINANVRLSCEDDSITVCPPVSGFEVTVTEPEGTLNNGTETAVAGVAVQVAAANTNRKKLIIQNVGVGNIRFGTAGVTATSGTRLTPGGHAIFDMPHCPTNAIFAIREGLISSIVLVQQVV